jgi:hypothetical protein
VVFSARGDSWESGGIVSGWIGVDRYSLTGTSGWILLAFQGSRRGKLGIDAGADGMGLDCWMVPWWYGVDKYQAGQGGTEISVSFVQNQQRDGKDLWQ